MSFNFNDDNLEKIELLKSKYPKVQALSLPLLWMAQYQDGFISLEAIQEIAKICETPMMEIYKVSTFYSMFNLQKLGKYHIQLCKTLSCKLCNKDDVLKSIQNELNIQVGESTSDGLFTLSQVECLGSCGTSPVMQLNETYYENLTPISIVEILKALK
ncbi:MAG: NADH-quinone oxidoreductase subunit NuoE [Helicobacteraceae bacterium]|nr:NADH-quinone oxidoreductase subunit NuoE [Helicobacteraceae bacterium]